MLVDRHGAAVALLVGVLTLLVGVLTLVGCANDDGGGSRVAPRATVTQGGEGRPIGGQPDPASRAVATSLRFVRGYLAFQAGRLTAEQVPDATAQLRSALRRLRIPPAAKDRRTEVIAAKLERIDQRSARVTVQVRNVDEQLDYPLPIDLISRPQGRWAVLSAGD
jgi:hypothetical protein